MTENLAPELDLVAPTRFTKDILGWNAWLVPLDEAELTEAHFAALVQRSRSRNEYFRLLVRDPDALRERTKTDNDIFLNTKLGLPRADREIAATAASRVNGCVYCVSVHAGFAAFHSKRPDDVERLLADGIDAELDTRWTAITDAAAALTATPPAFGPDHVRALRDAGLDELEILDVLLSGAFFNWANRLMLSLGEPSIPSA